MINDQIPMSNERSTLNEQGAQVRVRIFGHCVTQITDAAKVRRLAGRHWFPAPAVEDKGAQVRVRSPWRRVI